MTSSYLHCEINKRFIVTETISSYLFEEAKMMGRSSETSSSSLFCKIRMAPIDERAKPLADAALTSKLIQFIKTASDQRQVKRGANEVTKALNRYVP